MSNTLDKIVTKTKKKAAPSKDEFKEALLLKEAPTQTLVPKEEFNEPPRSACVTLGVSKEGVIVVGPGKFRKVFVTVEEARAWLKA